MQSRRQFLSLAALGALAHAAPHHAAKAKRVIFLFMQGGPSHMDMFEYKPELETRNGQPLATAL